MTNYDKLLLRCRRTLDLHPESDADLYDMEKIIANNIRDAATALAFYRCLYRNLLEYIEDKRYEELEHDQLGCSMAKTGIYAERKKEKE